MKKCGGIPENFKILSNALIVLSIIQCSATVVFADQSIPNEDSVMDQYRKCLNSGENKQKRALISSQLNAPGLTRMGIFSMIDGDARDVCISGDGTALKITMFKYGYDGNGTGFDLSGLKSHRVEILQEIFRMGFQDGFADSSGLTGGETTPAIPPAAIASITVIYFLGQNAKTVTDALGNEKTVKPALLKPRYWASLQAADAKTVNWSNLENVKASAFLKVFKEEWLTSKQWYLEDSGLPADGHK